MVANMTDESKPTGAGILSKLGMGGSGQMDMSSLMKMALLQSAIAGGGNKPQDWVAKLVGLLMMGGLGDAAKPQLKINPDTGEKAEPPPTPPAPGIVPGTNMPMIPPGETRIPMMDDTGGGMGMPNMAPSTPDSNQRAMRMLMDSGLLG